FFFFSSRRRHTRFSRDWSSDVCSSDLADEDLYGAIVEAVHEVMALPKRGDILVFLSGEREIRETANQLRRAELRNVEVVPLYARLSLKDQTRVFQPHRGTRIILATNVAETSLNVPGIRYVIGNG